MTDRSVVLNLKHSKTLRFAYACGVTPLFFGTVALCWWWLAPSNAPILLGVATIVVGTVLVLLGACLLAKTGWSKPRPSRPRLLVAGLILAVNFPTAYAYQHLVAARVTTNRYTFRNESGALIKDLAVFHRERQIGFRKTLEPNAATTIYFSALNNGGEGPISFSGIQGNGNAIGGKTGLMAFVFMKSHANITLLPNGEYQVVIQDFAKGIASGDAKLTKWPAATLQPNNNTMHLSR